MGININLAEPNNSALAILNNSKLQNEKAFNIAKITFHNILGNVQNKIRCPTSGHLTFSIYLLTVKPVQPIHHQDQ